ncbi:uncharacterized protein LOC131679209 [Topomyia yanbarensis]|uniref:uncharacterized protein LOC131679209 n=1 Tax=Topomyia yanbarensis TaxID=2498891 RepID=UPI00273B1248|nr:uncharacterized protein LOC131679209 [Topomyia yanbarensis]
MVGKFCSVHACYNKSIRKVSMHHFPKDPETCEKWVEFCKEDALNDVLVLQGPQVLHSSAYLVCSDHFLESCFYNPNNTSQGLRKGSIPSILPGHARPVSTSQQSQVLPNEPIPNSNAKVACKLPCPSCEEIEQFKSKFFEERFRAAELVKEYNAVQEKIKSLRAPYRDRHRAIARIKSSTTKLKNKIRRLAAQNGIQISLSSEDSDDGTNPS